MDLASFAAKRQYVEVPQGRIAYVAHGEGPTAVFLHGVPLNGAHWRDVIGAVAHKRRAVALDLMGLGHSDVGKDQDLTFTAQAGMVLAVMDALGVASFDLVGNDSGGGVSQIVAVTAPDRIRSLTLTNCDCHDNWPPPAFGQAVMLAKAGQLGLAMMQMLNNLELARSELGLGSGYEHREKLSVEQVQAYLEPVTANPTRMAQLDRFVASMDCTQTLAVEAKLKTLRAPTQIVWGTADVFFAREWADWLRKTIPGTTRIVEADGARLFFPEERPQWFAERLIEHWEAVDRASRS